MAPASSRGRGSIRPIGSGCSRDVNAAAAELGIDAGGIPIRAVQNEPGVHNVIVCTLVLVLPAPAARALAGLVQIARLSQPGRARAPRGAGRVRPGAAGGRRRGGPRQHRRAALHGGARAPGRHGGLERGAAGGHRDPRLPDRHGTSRSRCAAEPADVGPHAAWHQRGRRPARAGWPISTRTTAF